MSSSATPEIHPTALVNEHADVGVGVSIGPFTVVHAGVSIGDGSAIGSHCVVGEPTADHYRGTPGDPRPCVIGAGGIVRSHTVVYQGATIGDGFESGHRVTIREGSLIGDGVRIGTGCDLQGDLVVGDHVRLHSNVFVPGRTTIEDFVWLFPGVTLTNDPHPPSDTCLDGATIRRFAVIAARAVLLPGVEVGEHALVGAMSLATRDVEAGTVVAGVPARPVGPTSDVKCRHAAGLERDVYPWPDHFRRGYPAGILPGSDRS